MAERGVLTYSEVQRYQDLGLGRGVNVTDPQMWRNKSPFQIRNVCPNLSNIIGTEESGLKEKYEKEVSTVATQQLKIKLSLDEPSSRVKIGMDAHNSQSTSSTKIIAGMKVHTRTISFQIDFDDLPLYASVDKIGVEVPTLDSEPDESEKRFETNLYSWILERIRDRQSKSDKEGDFPGKIEILVGECSPSKLSDYLNKVSEQSTELKAVANDCKVFVKDLGITHYVSALELGALKYSVSTTSSQQQKLGAGANLGAGDMVEGGISGKIEKHWFNKTKEEQDIGRISKDGTVKRSTEDEAVIGFQIQPIHKMIRIQYIQLALQMAIKVYIQIKADKSEGPFLISGQVNCKPVYWTVDDEHHYVIGTESLKEASLFYIIPTQDTYHPSDFLIAYYGKHVSDRKRVMNVYDPFSKLRHAPPLPLYLTCNCSMLGSSSGPLHLLSTVLVQQARFSLYSRVQPSFACMMCMSTPVSLSSWIEGEKFYINCSKRSFKIDGYIAMKQQECEPNYKTVTVPTMKDPSNSKSIGMLFRLHPPEYRGFQTQAAPTTEAGEQPPTTEAGEQPPPTEAGEQPPPTEAGGPPPPPEEPHLIELSTLVPQSHSEPPVARKRARIPKDTSKSVKQKNCECVLNPDSYAGQYQKVFGVDD